jgi:GT2 family glycosyltransferase
MKPLISLIVINYNTKHLLPACMESLKNQDYDNIEIILIDNDSADGTCQYMQENYPKIITVCNKDNLGYAGAGNQGIKLAKGDYVMTLNPDIIFEPSYIKNCIKKMEEDSKIGVIGGKLYKYNFKNNHKTNYIDTVGIFSYKNRRFIDDGQGLKDKGQFDEEGEVFGVSGACPIYRRAALEDIKIFDEYFDGDFFMYKEDVDISWRLRLRGWKCYYLPKAVAHHGRGTGVLKRFTHIEVMKNRKKLNQFQKYHSYKNQRLMQIKNDYGRGVLSNFFPILWREILVSGYVLFREPYLIKSMLHALKLASKMRKKRRIILKNARVGWKEMEKWLAGKQSKYLQYELDHPEDDVA